MIPPHVWSDAARERDLMAVMVLKFAIIVKATANFSSHKKSIVFCVCARQI